MDTKKEIVEIRELDPEIIPPFSDKVNIPTYEGGSKIVVVGKPGTGKSSLIKGLLYCKRHIFASGPLLMALSHSQKVNLLQINFRPSSSSTLSSSLTLNTFNVNEMYAATGL